MLYVIPKIRAVYATPITIMPNVTLVIIMFNFLCKTNNKNDLYDTNYENV